ncbi:MAG: ATP-binding protein [Chromatiales bacterium]|nr:ATP-binding protein [Chromatiales bacterium]
MKLGALVLGIVVSVLLLAAAGVLHTLRDDTSRRHYLTSIDLVREGQQLSATWSVEVARVRADPLTDFDTITDFALRMEQIRSRLRETSRLIPDIPSRTVNTINLFLSAVDAKEESVERFKTTYAVVRNSARYLPLAAATVTRQAEASGIESLGAGIAGLTQELNRYLVTPTDTLKARLNGDLETLRESSVGYPPPLANALANLLTHAEILISRQVPMNTLFQKATSDEVFEFGSRLLDALEIERDKAITLATYYDRGFLSVIAVLAAFWVLLFVQQWTSARKDAAPAPAGATPAPHAGIDFGDAQDLEAFVDEGAARPATGAAGGAQAAPAPAPPTNLSAEAAMLHRFLAERVGRDLVASAEKVSVRLDSLRRIQRKIQQVLQDSELTVDLPGGEGLDEEIEAGAAIAEHAHREVNGIVSLVRRFASFPGLPAGDDERSMVDVNACIEEVIAAMDTDRVATVSMQLDTVPEVFASKAEIRLVLAQIVENAMHAVRGPDETREGSIKIGTMLRDDEVLVTIIDNGTGIAPDQRRHIFRPFYTTRDDAVGLGLTLAGTLVRQYEGSIKISSLLDQGTVVRIALPTGTRGP